MYIHRSLMFVCVSFCRLPDLSHVIMIGEKRPLVLCSVFVLFSFS